MSHKRLSRVWYATDVNDDEPAYLGAYSAPFPDPAHNGNVIVDVDWSERGWVQVTYLGSAP